MYYLGIATGEPQVHSYLCLALFFNAIIIHPGPTNLLHSFSNWCEAAGRETLIKQQMCIRREKMVDLW